MHDASPTPDTLASWPALMARHTAAAYLQLSPRAARRLLLRERVAPVVLGPRTLRWRRTDLDAVAERLGAGPYAGQAAAAEDALACVARREGRRRPGASGRP
ncbi:hypothetical protein [Phenylobacterium sp.]|uniref:hypothetical protein n=1 Tax=Phenylobacterium sp. TaxID=1871053 RepID=UPI002F938073